MKTTIHVTDDLVARAAVIMQRLGSEHTIYCCGGEWSKPSGGSPFGQPVNSQ